MLPHIEGLKQGHEDIHALMQDDTSPGATIVTFEVVRTYMPALSEREGSPIYQNFVHCKKVMNLGQFIKSRRIRDKVKWNEETQKWEVVKLANKLQSDILRYPDEWNAFYRGTSEVAVGTPLEELFPNNPALIEQYSRFGINSVERLAFCTDTDAQSLPMGASDHIKQAKAYVEAIKLKAPTARLEYELKEKDKQIASLQNQLSAVLQKLDALVDVDEDGVATRKKRSRGKKTQEAPSDE